MTLPDFKPRSLVRISEKEFEERVQGKAKYFQSEMRETPSIQNNTQARNLENHERVVAGRFCNINATQDKRENSFCSAIKNQQNQPRDESHKGSDRDSKGGEGLEGKVDKRKVIYAKESNLGRDSSGSLREKTTCSAWKSTSYLPESTCRVVTPLEVAVNKVKEQGWTEVADSFWRKRKQAFRSDPSSDSIKNLKKDDMIINEDNSMTTFPANEAKKKLIFTEQRAYEGSDPLVVLDEKKRNDIDARLAPPGPRSSKGKDAYLNLAILSLLVSYYFSKFYLIYVTCKFIE